MGTSPRLFNLVFYFNKVSPCWEVLMSEITPEKEGTLALTSESDSGIFMNETIQNHH